MLLKSATPAKPQTKATVEVPAWTAAEKAANGTADAASENAVETDRPFTQHNRKSLFPTGAAEDFSAAPFFSLDKSTDHPYLFAQLSKTKERKHATSKKMQTRDPHAAGPLL